VEVSPVAFWNRAKPDPLGEARQRVEHLQLELAAVSLERELSMTDLVPLSEAGPLRPPSFAQTVSSPFVEAASTPSRSLLPWRRSNAVATAQPAPLARPVVRRGYVDNIPIGGTTPYNSGTSSTPGAPDRDTAMTELLQAYLTCPWVSTCVDGIARTITAGGLTLEPVNTDPEEMAKTPTPPPGIARIQALLDYVNPSDDVRQLMRRAITDALIFGDAFVEVTWLGPEPVALWPLDCQTMSVISDEHGNIGRMVDGKLVGYTQTTETGMRVDFEPHEIIHVKLDAPGASLYGVSPTSKAHVAIETWLFAASLLEQTMKRGDPPRLHVDWPMVLAEPEVRKASSQYASRNLGPRNIGNLFETRGGVQGGGTKVTELSQNKIEYWMAVKEGARDDILSTFGVPKRKAGVAVPGSLGGAGAEEGENRTFMVTTCGPYQELVLEKFSFALCYQAYGVKDWRIVFAKVDWRDELIIEQIRDLRLRNGSWDLDRLRKDIGEPPTKGGDKPVLVDRQNLVLWQDLEQLSAKNAAPAPAGLAPTIPGAPGAPGAPQSGQPALPGGKKPKPALGKSDDDEEDEIQPGEPLAEYFARRSWRNEYQRRRAPVSQP
jgi:hypothetical protein